MKLFSLLLLLLISTLTYSQKEKSSKMGQTTLDELKMTIYDKDSTASAVVLYEHANVYLDPNYDHKTRTDYYYRIKIFDKTTFDLASITINQYKEKKIKDIKAITYNLSESGTVLKSYLSADKIYTLKESKKWTTQKFTMPNIKEGCVIEYKYSIISPYLGLSDWYFQSSIPKIKSEFDAAILGNYNYNVRIIGYLKLDKDDPSVKKKCVYIDGLGDGACAIYSYGMDHIPAFKEEDYMLSKKNYISRLAFDLKTYTSTRGEVERYTTTWKEADRKLRKIFLNNQTAKKSFFKKNLPESVLNITDDVERAKTIYSFIQNHFTWNEEYWNSEDEKIKQAFNNKTGSAGEINLSLYNSLRAAKIDANLVILSTRNNGVPTTLYPVIFDFNYVIVRTVIDGVEYYLDATNKYLPFGQVPQRCLNGQARLMDYSGESNWVVLKPKLKTLLYSTTKLVLSEDGNLTGNLTTIRKGYFAIRQREKINSMNEESYLEGFESNNPAIEVDDYKVSFKEDVNKPLQQVYNINISLDEALNNTVRLNPFIYNQIKDNPFKLKERNYPVDYAYARNFNSSISIEIPENYKVTQLPKKIAISLPNKGGQFILNTILRDNIIKIYTRLNINRTTYSAEEYYSLKEFYKQIIVTESGYIILEKK
jgi:hypothetical protein